MFCWTRSVYIEKSLPFLRVKFQLIKNRKTWLVHISKWHGTTDHYGLILFSGLTLSYNGGNNTWSEISNSIRDKKVLSPFERLETYVIWNKNNLHLAWTIIRDLKINSLSFPKWKGEGEEREREIFSSAIYSYPSLHPPCIVDY